MQAILAVTIPFFALVLLGWFAARSYWLPESAIPGLNAYVLFFALPCMLFRFGSSLPFARLADPVRRAVYVVAGSSGKVSLQNEKSAKRGYLDHSAMFLSLPRLGSLVLDVNGNRLDATFLSETGERLDYFSIVKGKSSTLPPVPSVPA